MNHWIILPILLPAVVAPLLAMSVRHDIVLARVFSVGSAVLLLILGLILLGIASSGETLTYSLGGWVPPYGIVLVLDRLSALMLVLTSLLGLCVLLYAISGCDTRGQHFHPLFQFQLMGLNGAFLTGDLFNLFVFFEVLLIASYGLMVHGGGAARVRAGIQYVVINLVGSSLFLIALGLIYGASGTLNMADLARMLPTISESARATLMTGATLLLIVFGVKSALFPLHFWLPGTYANTSGPIAALFAIMTKVGVYSIIRTQTLAVGIRDVDVVGTLPWGVTDWVLPAASITLVIGMVGVVGARSLGQQASFLALGSIGTLLIAVAAFTPQSTSAALYYTLHSTLGMAALFLIIDMVIVRRPGEGDAIATASRFDNVGLISGLFFVAAIAMLGMPPLSGFVGKLFILDSLRGTSAWPVMWGLILGTSLIALVGFSRSGTTIFWKCTSVDGELVAPGEVKTVLPTVAIGSLIALLVLLTGAAGWIGGFLDEVTDQLFHPEQYIQAVLEASQKET